MVGIEAPIHVSGVSTGHKKSLFKIYLIFSFREDQLHLYKSESPLLNLPSLIPLG